MNNENGIPGAPPLNPPGTRGLPAGYEDFYVENTATGVFEALITSLPDVPARDFHADFMGSTPDLSHVLLSTEASLTPEAVDDGEQHLYEWSAGKLLLVSVPPAGETLGSAVLPGESNATGLLSEDGSRLIFESEGLLYDAAIEGSTVTTVRVPDDESKDHYLGASSDGMKVFFSHGEGELYEYDVATGRSTDLTPAAGEDGGVLGALGVSADGSSVYFVSTAQLATGGVAGGANLYLWHEGQPMRFITTLSAQLDEHDWSPRAYERMTRVTQDGRYLAFLSAEDLKTANFPVGYDNRDAVTGLPDVEVYLYDAGSGELECASCDPSGALPVAPSGPEVEALGSVAYDSSSRGLGSDQHGVAAFIPAVTQFEDGSASGQYSSHALSDDGRLFFDSYESLVAQDTNGREDVYEFEDGHSSLISGGGGASSASFIDATPDASDVFFVTGQTLVSQDVDDQHDVYDARVDGGFPVAPTAPECSGSGCQGVPGAPPIFATPSSVTFEGVGNFAAPSVSSGKPKPKAKSKKAANAVLLRRALRACAEKAKAHRAACKRRARQAYGSSARKSASRRGQS